jgi:hypothetical protein
VQITLMVFKPLISMMRVGMDTIYVEKMAAKPLQMHIDAVKLQYRLSCRLLNQQLDVIFIIMGEDLHFTNS